jgi:hypothetical protein
MAAGADALKDKTSVRWARRTCEFGHHSRSKARQFLARGHAGRQKLEVGDNCIHLRCLRRHDAPIHAARHAAVHSLFDGDLRSGAGAVLRKFSKQSEEWKSEFLRSKLEMTVTAREIVARIAIGDVRNLRTNVCVGGGNEITTSPHKPGLFVIGEGADFGRGPNCIS